VSSTKPELHNVLHFVQKKTNQVTATGNMFRNLDEWFLRYASGQTQRTQTNRQTHRQTHRQADGNTSLTWWDEVTIVRELNDYEGRRRSLRLISGHASQCEIMSDHDTWH